MRHRIKILVIQAVQETLSRYIYPKWIAPNDKRPAPIARFPNLPKRYLNQPSYVFVLRLRINHSPITLQPPHTKWKHKFWINVKDVTYIHVPCIFLLGTINSFHFGLN